MGRTPGSTKYWIDRARYELADLRLEPDEMRALQVAVAATRTGSELGQEAMWKLGSGVIDRESAVVATMPSLPGLPMLREAIDRRATVDFLYRDVDRTVEPYGLLLRDGFWYLVASTARAASGARSASTASTGGSRWVAATRSSGRTASTCARVLPDDPKLLGADGATAEAIVRVDAVAGGGRHARARRGSRASTRRTDGDVDVRVPCANREAFRSWVLGLARARRGAVATRRARRRRRLARTSGGRLMARAHRGAEERLRRLLVMLPWLMERGEVPLGRGRRALPA